MYVATTSVTVESPVPMTTTTWPGLAEGSARRPACRSAVEDRPVVTHRRNGAVVPPAVVTVMGPKMFWSARRSPQVDLRAGGVDVDGLRPPLSSVTEYEPKVYTLLCPSTSPAPER